MNHYALTLYLFDHILLKLVALLVNVHVAFDLSLLVVSLTIDATSPRYRGALEDEFHIGMQAQDKSDTAIGKKSHCWCLTAALKVFIFFPSSALNTLLSFYKLSQSHLQPWKLPLLLINLPLGMF
jgi:hypothetical protein